MSNQIEPMIKLDPNPTGVPVLSYNVPEPTSYTGQNFLELDFILEGETAKDYFKPDCFKSKNEAENKEISALKTQDNSIINEKVISAFKSNIGNTVFANAKMPTGILKFTEDNGVTKIVSDQKISDSLSNIKADEVPQEEEKPK